jgi:hypothetical protein
MLDWAIGGLSDLLGFAGNAVGSAIGWAWDKVISGIYTWLAKGLALLIQWVWGVLDTSTTPHLDQAWFAKTLMGRLGLIALAVTIAMMLASAIHAALAGRPEQIADAIKAGVHAIVASALTVSVITVLIGITDEAAAMVWQIGRADLVTMLDRIVTVTMTTGPLGQTFIGPLCLLFGYLGLLGLTVALFMRNALIYLAAALAPIVWSTSVLPMFRSSTRKLVHLTVSLIVSKLAIVITLVVAVKLIANTGAAPNTNDVVRDGATAVGTLVSGFVCFLIAAVTPVVLYKLMPTVEGAALASGIAGGWTRGATTAGHSALMAKSLGASAATRSVASQAAGPAAGALAGTAASSGGAQSGAGDPDAGTAAGSPTRGSGMPVAVGSLATGGSAPGSSDAPAAGGAPNNAEDASPSASSAPAGDGSVTGPLPATGHPSSTAALPSTRPTPTDGPPSTPRELHVDHHPPDHRAPMAGDPPSARRTPQPPNTDGTSR